MATFNLLKEYLKGINFSSPHTPEFFFKETDTDSTLSINIDIESKSSSDNIYDVTVIVSLSPCTSSKEVFHLDVKYASIVSLNLPVNATDSEKRKVLMVDVPQTLYPIIRDFVAQITFRSGFPPVELVNFDFEQNYKSKYCTDIDEHSSDVADESLIDLWDETHLSQNDSVAVHADENTEISEGDEFSYESLVSTFTDTEEGKGFVQTCISHGMNPDLALDETPMYKYLMRFIPVPDFEYPVIDGTNIDWEFFRNLYRMLALDENASYNFVKEEDNLELYVTYGSLVDKPISKMNLAELDLLATDLIINSWIYYNVPLSQLFPEGCQPKADEYLRSLGDLGLNKMITKDEYMALFSFANPVPFDWDKVRGWYRKLQAIALSTIQYRF